MYVLMVVPSDFPNGDAAAVRDMSFAYIYQKLGYEVVLIGAGKKDKEAYFNRVHYYSVYREAKTFIDHLRRFYCAQFDYKELIDHIFEEKGVPSIIHINSIPEKTINYLISLSYQKHIVIIHDSTEWYSPCEFKHGKYDKAYIIKDRLNTKIIRQPIRVVGISSYLTEHFRDRGLQVVRIPVIMEVKNTRTSINKDSKIKLIYAGSPAKKDYLKEIILGTTMLTVEEQSKIELHILGVSKKEIMQLTELKVIPAYIHVYGRVSREKVEEVMIGMDFSTLLRPTNERYTKAGFPTKSVEAMAHGVAMICNISSDLGLYLKDGINSIIVDGYDSIAFCSSLKRVVSMSREEIDSLKYNARLLCEKEFDYRNWIDIVSAFIGNNYSRL